MLDFFTQFAKEIHSFFHNAGKLISKRFAYSGEPPFRRSSTTLLYGKDPASRGLCQLSSDRTLPAFSARQEALRPAWAPSA
jgi:hypothetical protein